MPVLENRHDTANPYGRMGHAVENSLQAYKPYRDLRRKHIRHYLGNTYYHSRGTSERSAINLVELYVRAIRSNLMTGTPRCRVRTDLIELKPFAADYEGTINEAVRRIRFRDTMQLLLFDSIFMMGVAKCGLSDGPLSYDGINYGQYFCDRVDLDDLVPDMTARNWEDAQYIGNQYQLRVKDALEARLIDRREARQFGQQEARRLSHTDEVVNALGSHPEMLTHVEDVIWLFDFWLPYEGVVLTVPRGTGGYPAFDGRVVKKEWDGPKRGPYHLLFYEPIPDNLMPYPPIAALIEQHRFINALHDKIERQARAQATVYATDPNTAERESVRWRSANDLDLVGIANPQGVQTIPKGGFDPNNWTLETRMIDVFSYFAGGLNTFAGLNPQAPTATQEVLLNQNANRMLDRMNNAVLEFVGRIFSDLGDYVWNDPLIRQSLIRTIRGTDIEFRSEFSADRRIGEREDYRIEVDAFSLQYESPQQKLLGDIAIIERLWPMIQQGLIDGTVQIDAAKLLQMAGKARNSEAEFAEFLRYSTPARQDQPANRASRPLQSAVTQRNYTRRTIGADQQTPFANADKGMEKRNNGKA